MDLLMADGVLMADVFDGRGASMYGVRCLMYDVRCVLMDDVLGCTICIRCAVCLCPIENLVR